MPEKEEEYIKKIQDALFKVHHGHVSETEKRRNPFWTNAFLSALKKLGEEEFEVYSSSVQNHNCKEYGEWLVDFSWSDEKNGKFNGLYLVCESEWGGINQIKYDFQKLPVIKARIKLMIFQCYEGHDTKPQYREIVEKCLGSVSRNLLNDNSYCCFFGSDNHDDPIFETYFNGSKVIFLCSNKQFI